MSVNPIGTVTEQPGIEMNQLSSHRSEDQKRNQQNTITVQPRQISHLSVPGSISGSGVTWMPMMSTVAGIPPGLEYLTLVDTVVVTKVIEILEIITTWPTKSKYVLKTQSGQMMYYAFEESNSTDTSAFGPMRPFTIHVTDNFMREILTIRRPMKCCGGCFGMAVGLNSCTSEIQIEASREQKIGSVRQRNACCSTCFNVMDETGARVLSIDGDCFAEALCVNKEFAIKMNLDTIGRIAKRDSGVSRSQDNPNESPAVFSVTFPMELNANLKGILLGAAFLLDIMELDQTHS